jgi:mRNA interferase MazF
VGDAARESVVRHDGKPYGSAPTAGGVDGWFELDDWDPVTVDSFPIDMAIVVPCTTVDRGLPHHVPVDWEAAGLDRPTWVRTEDLRSISERRLVRRAPLGQLTSSDLAEVRRYVRLMIDDD